MVPQHISAIKFGVSDGYGLRGRGATIPENAWKVEVLTHKFDALSQDL